MKDRYKRRHEYSHGNLLTHSDQTFVIELTSTTSIVSQVLNNHSILTTNVQ